MHQIQYYFGITLDSVGGLVYGMVNHNYADCSGYISGYVVGNINEKTCQGSVNGILTNYVFNQNIPIYGEISGNLAEDARLVEENYYYYGSPSGYIISINTISGVFINPEPFLVSHDHVLNIKLVNTLGRKALSKANSILGTDLNKTTKNVDEYEQYGLEKWQLIEYVSINNSIPHEIPIYPDNTLNIPSQQSIQTMNTRTRLATPKYINKLNNLMVDTLMVDNTEEQPLNEINEEEHIYKYTVNFIYNGNLKINKYLENDIINTDGLLIGPILDKNELLENLEEYVRNNNYELIQLSDDEFTLKQIEINEIIF